MPILTLSSTHHHHHHHQQQQRVLLLLFFLLRAPATHCRNLCTSTQPALNPHRSQARELSPSPKRASSEHRASIDTARERARERESVCMVISRVSSEKSRVGEYRERASERATERVSRERVSREYRESSERVARVSRAERQRVLRQRERASLESESKGSEREGLLNSSRSCSLSLSPFFNRPPLPSHSHSHSLTSLTLTHSLSLTHSRSPSQLTTQKAPSIAEYHFSRFDCLTVIYVSVKTM